MLKETRNVSEGRSGIGVRDGSVWEPLPQRLEHFEIELATFALFSTHFTVG